MRPARARRARAPPVSRASPAAVVGPVSGSDLLSLLRYARQLGSKGTTTMVVDF